MDLIAVGFKEDEHGSLGICDPVTHKILAQHPMSHTSWINSVIYIKQRGYVLTCSDDSTIRVYHVSAQGRVLKAVATLRTYANKITHMRYIETCNLLVSAEEGYGLVMWDVNRLKRIGTIKIDPQISIEGNIMSIEKDKLIGVPLSNDCIRLYHINKRTIAFEFNANHEDYKIKNPIYLPRRRLVITNVSQSFLREYKYNEIDLKIESSRYLIVESFTIHRTFVSENEEVLFYLFKEQLAMYNFDTKKTTYLQLPSGLTGYYSLVPLKHGKVFLYNSYTQDVYILG